MNPKRILGIASLLFSYLVFTVAFYFFIVSNLIGLAVAGCLGVLSYAFYQYLDYRIGVELVDDYEKMLEVEYDTYNTPHGFIRVRKSEYDHQD